MELCVASAVNNSFMLCFPSSSSIYSKAASASSSPSLATVINYKRISWTTWPSNKGFIFYNHGSRPLIFNHSVGPTSNQWRAEETSYDKLGDGIQEDSMDDEQKNRSGEAFQEAIEKARDDLREIESKAKEVLLTGGSIRSEVKDDQRTKEILTVDHGGIDHDQVEKDLSKQEQGLTKNGDQHLHLDHDQVEKDLKKQGHRLTKNGDKHLHLDHDHSTESPLDHNISLEEKSIEEDVDEVAKDHDSHSKLQNLASEGFSSQEKSSIEEDVNEFNNVHDPHSVKSSIQEEEDVNEFDKDSDSHSELQNMASKDSVMMDTTNGPDDVKMDTMDMTEYRHGQYDGNMEMVDKVEDKLDGQDDVNREMMHTASDWAKDIPSNNEDSWANDETFESTFHDDVSSRNRDKSLSTTYNFDDSEATKGSMLEASTQKMQEIGQAAKEVMEGVTQKAKEAMDNIKQQSTIKNDNDVDDRNTIRRRSDEVDDSS